MTIFQALLIGFAVGNVAMLIAVAVYAALARSGQINDMEQRQRMQKMREEYHATHEMHR